MTDSTAEQMPATVREWTDILARIRFGKVPVGRRNLAGSSIKLVAARLADYADSNGTRVRPGLARLALDVEVDYRTAKAAVAYLRTVGLLALMRPGGRNGTDEFRLTLPVDLLDRDDLQVWSPTRQRLEVERLSDSHRRLPRTPKRGPDDDGSQGRRAPVNEPASQGQDAPVKRSDSAHLTGACGPSSDPITGACGHVSQGQGAPATDQDLNTTTTDHPDEALRTAVTLSREPSPATEPEPSSAKSKRCPHGLTPARRSDGRPACALCRVAEDRPATQHPPPAGEHLAIVIQLPTREAS